MLGKNEMRKTIFIHTLILLLIVFEVFGTVNCSNLITDISIDIDDKPYINPKTSFFAELPLEYATQNMRCLSYVKSLEGNIIQINPEKKEYSEVKIPIFRKEEETREFFTALNGVVNAYITYLDLVSYTGFLLEIECVSDTGVSIIGQKCITPYYKELKNVGTRAAWSLQNADMLIILIIALAVIIVFLGVFYRKLFKH